MPRTEPFFDTWYQCGEHKFSNIYQAFDHQKETGHFPYLVLDPEFLKNLQGIKRPKNLNGKYIKNLIVKTLKYYRDRYQYVRLFWGGGIDSTTILKYCIEHNIYIDEVYCAMASVIPSPRANIEYLPGLKYAEKFIGTHIGKVTHRYPTVDELPWLNSPTWYKDPKLAPGSNSYTSSRRYSMYTWSRDTEWPIEDTVCLTGIEKPYIIKTTDGKYFYTMVDSSIGDMMGVDNVLPVLMDKNNPELTACMTFAFIDVAREQADARLPDNSVLLSHDMQPNKNELTEKLGMQNTGRRWLDLSMHGKNNLHDHSKQKGFWQSLVDIGRTDLIKKFYVSQYTIGENYRDLKHAIKEFPHKLGANSIVRWGEKVQVLPNQFGNIVSDQLPKD